MKTALNLKYIIFAFLVLIGSIASGQNNVLVILAHPDFNQSEVNSYLASKLDSLEGVTINNLYEKYPDFKIDIAKEQELLVANDLIIFQFPLYWFSSPALLREWQDVVITSAFSLGENNQLRGKKLMIVVSVGGTDMDYRHGGLIGVTMDEILIPFESFARLTEMNYVTPFVTFSVPNPNLLNILMTDEQKTKRLQLIESQGNKLVALINSIE